MRLMKVKILLRVFLHTNTLKLHLQHRSALAGQIHGIKAPGDFKANKEQAWFDVRYGAIILF